MKTDSLFNEFLEEFIPNVARKNEQLAKAIWILETTGSSDAADLVAELHREAVMLFNSREQFDRLTEWEKGIEDPLLKRQMQVLLRMFKGSLFSAELIEMLAKKEAALAEIYANFRPQFEEKEVSENDLNAILKNEKDPKRRKEAWQATKEIGEVLAPKILELVELRNQGAKSLGYSDFFKMQLDLQEVEEKWLFTLLEEVAEKSDASYSNMLDEIEAYQCEKFGVKKEELGPWAWNEPFSQEDPMEAKELDSYLEGADLCELTREFFDQMGINVDSVMEKSDMFERAGKNQHAFCINMDRKKDVRTLNNIKPSMKWLETLYHEFGHAIYDLGYDETLPWLLRQPPHMFLTEAMAMIAGRQAYLYEPLKGLATTSLNRKQLIISRWILVMTYFERELYKNPDQDLQKLWWKTVEKYQKIKPSMRPEGKKDWAAKYHIGLAPVYYFSYLLGELFASAMEESIFKVTGSKTLNNKNAGQFFQDKLFFPGDRMSWSDLVRHVTGDSLNSKAWVKQFA